MEDERRKQLEIKNLDAWEGNLVEPASLDSSLKKNTAFVKKLKTSINKDACATILKEINTLSLKKYESELILGTQEGLLKCTKSADIPAAVEIVSALHQRFQVGFTPGLLQWLVESLENPSASTSLTEKEEKDRITKVKILLRLFIEFVSVGLFSSIDRLESVPNFITQRMKNGDNITVAVLKEVLGYKMRTGITLSVATTFVKRFPTLIQTDSSVSNVLKSFTEAIINRSKASHDKLKELTQRKYKAQIRTGRIVEELETEFNELSELFESMRTAVETLAPVFDLEIPTYEDNDENLKTETDSIVIAKDNVWTNDEEKRFYTVFTEIPKELIEEAKNASQDASKAEEMNDFLVTLETANTAKEVDEASLEFWTLKLSNKASKNRLLKHITQSKDVGRAKIYSRFLKTNEPYLDDIKEEVLQYLDQGFRSQIYHNGLNFRNIVFFSEMIKFELIPEHVVFHKIRSLILNLTTPFNIEILSIFFEISGRYLLHEHNKLMEEMLTLLTLKKKNDKLTINNKMAISNLYLVLKPPTVKSLQSNLTVLKPEQLFLKTLIRNELNLTNFNIIKKLILKANFEDEDILKTTISLFTKPDKINYENIVPLSHILKGMGANFKIYVVDTIIEDIIRAMEVNDYRFNRIRVAQCKYFAEIYERKIVGLNVVHDLIYKILTFGHPNNNPTWTKISELDPPDDYFRIQMVTVLLNSLTFKKTKQKEGKITTVLKFFDYYIHLKDHPIPKDFEFKMSHTFEKYNFERSANLKEAVDRLNEVIKARNLKNENGNENDEDEDEEDEDDEEEDEDDEEEQDDDEGDEDEEGEVDKELTSLEKLKISTSDEDQTQEDHDQVRLSYEAYERKLMEEEEKKIEDRLEKEFNRMVFESMHTQKGNKVPLEFPQGLQGNKAEDIIKNDTNTNGTHIPFTLITKTGKGIATKNLSLPKDVKFASNVVEEERKRRTQKEQINKYILQSSYDD